MSNINELIFKACDIRGIYNKELFDEDFYKIAKAFAQILIMENKTTCVVGYDCRLSSVTLFNQLKKGLIEEGIKVYTFYDYVSTPFIYFALDFLKADSAIMITASHNPYFYNGCKFVMSDRIFHQNDILELKNIIEKDSFKNTNDGIEEKVELKNEYIDYLLGNLNISKLKNKKIVWDCANGATSFVINDFVDKLPSNNILMFSEPDGNFPNHKPDPSKEENLLLVKQKVLEEKADVGISFDGDGDRVGFVDNKGRYIDGNQLLILLSKDFLNSNPGEKVMSEVKASKALYSSIEEFGGVPVMWKVGHTNQKSKMKSDNIKFAGETSGHIFYADNNYYDDGMYASIKLLNYLFTSEKSLSVLVDQLPLIINCGEIRLEMSEEERDEFISIIKAELIKNKRGFVDIDGMRVDYEKGFWLLRKSNTEPHITLYCESNTEENYKEVVADLKYYISKTSYNLVQL